MRTARASSRGARGPRTRFEKALFFAQLDEGVPVNSDIVLPIDGSLDGATLSSTVTFALEGGAGGSLPPLVMLKATVGATAAADFEVVSVSASFDDAIRVQPAIPLEVGHAYVVVATSAIKDGERPQKPVAAAPPTTLLVGKTPIAAGAIEGLDATGAERLERARLSLAPIVSLLAKASPPIPAEKITSIQMFTTVPNPLERTSKIFAAYQAAVRQGRYPFKVTTEGGGDRDPAELYPGLPAIAYQSIMSYRRGTITVPQVLGDDLRQRDNFPQVVREIEVPFIITIPRSPPPYGVVLYVPGFGRSKLDVRALANEMAGTPKAAVLAIDLRCEGDRAPDASGVCADGRTETEIAALADALPNNNNMELVGPDGVPDASGQYFFPGDARALRDTQIAAAIEILHVYKTLRDSNAFLSQGLSPDPNHLHVVAQGDASLAALMAVAFSEIAPKTVQVPSGGTGFQELILGGPEPLKSSFVATLPEGIGAARAEEYLARLEAGFLRSVAIETIGPLVKDKLAVGGEARRLLLNHPNGGTWVPVSARQRLTQGVPIPASRVSQHLGNCDDFFIFSCLLGNDSPQHAREQFVAFVNSDGGTVLTP